MKPQKSERKRRWRCQPKIGARNSFAPLTPYRLLALDDAFVQLQVKEDNWPPLLPDMRNLYAGFYHEMHGLVHNIVCAYCGCIQHSPSLFDVTSTSSTSLALLPVDRDLVPFDFACRIKALDSRDIMIDKLGIIPDATGSG